MGGVVLGALRNLVAHGVRPAELPPRDVLFLIELADRLFKIDRAEGTTNLSASGGLRFGGSATVSLFRSSLNRNEYLKGLADQASKMLGDVLGPNRGSVSDEWELVEDAEGQPRVTLKLSDFTGEVAASFDPSEFSDKEHLRLRLSLLCGDLMKIRSYKQLDALMNSSGKGS